MNFFYALSVTVLCGGVTSQYDEIESMYEALNSKVPEKKWLPEQFKGTALSPDLSPPLLNKDKIQSSSLKQGYPFNIQQKQQNNQENNYFDNKKQFNDIERTNKEEENKVIGEPSGISGEVDKLSKNSLSYLNRERSKKNPDNINHNGQKDFIDYDSNSQFENNIEHQNPDSYSDYQVKDYNKEDQNNNLGQKNNHNPSGWRYVDNDFQINDNFYNELPDELKKPS